MGGARTAVVVPCFDEEDRLDGTAFLAYVAARPHVRLIFVDDGSRDGTAALLERLRAAEPDSVVVESLPANRGKGEAVRAGLRRGVALGVEYVGYWDADLSTPLDALADFESVLDWDPGVEGVIGSRVKLLGRTIERYAWRHYVGRIFATVASLALGLPVYDTQCGAKLFRVTPELRAAVETPFRGRWVFDVELLDRLTRDRRPDGHAIVEYPLEEWRDAGGSKVRPIDGLVALGQLFMIGVRRRTARPSRAAPGEDRSGPRRRP